MAPEDQSVKIRNFILSNLPQHPTDIVPYTAAAFSISRQAVSRHIKGLVADQLIEKTGITRNLAYRLGSQYAAAPFIEALSIKPGMSEDVLWQNKLLPLLRGVKPNVLGICDYGFTEMCNNVFSHALAHYLIIGLDRSAGKITLRIGDDGIGIFEKIRAAANLDDPREAILELSKGKFTTNPAEHSGEGVFFTSRMFDEFHILSGGLIYIRDEEEWLLQREPEDYEDARGTYVTMTISTGSARTTKSVFDEYNGKDFSFSRTHVPLKLAQMGDQSLISRSQAKRVLSRFEKFNEVILDFKGVEEIGQGFADEIFRVFRRAHPNIAVIPVNACVAVAQMIVRAENTGGSEQATKPKENG